MSIIDLGVPGIQVTEEEDFVHLRLIGTEEHEIFSAYGATPESLREAASAMVQRRIDHRLRVWATRQGGKDEVEIKREAQVERVD